MGYIPEVGEKKHASQSLKRNKFQENANRKRIAAKSILCREASNLYKVCFSNVEKAFNGRRGGPGARRGGDRP